MSFQSFLLKHYAKWKMKDVPEAQREQMTALVSRDPELFKKIGEEVQKKVKSGMSQTDASMQVMKKYEKELKKLV